MSVRAAPLPLPKAILGSVALEAGGSAKAVWAKGNFGRYRGVGFPYHPGKMARPKHPAKVQFLYLPLDRVGGVDGNALVKFQYSSQVGKQVPEVQGNPVLKPGTTRSPVIGRESNNGFVVPISKIGPV